MPTYLTPGVYVEEMPSASKPIEGVGTSTAAFVGLAPGGPINSPMRITTGRSSRGPSVIPRRPTNGPFIEGAYLGACRLRLLPERWAPVLGRARRRRPAPRQAARAALPAAAHKDVEAYRIVALEGADERTVRVEVQEEPRPRREHERDKTYTLIDHRRRHSAGGVRWVSATRRGRPNLATKINSGSKLIQHRGAGGSLPEGQRAPRAREPTPCRRRRDRSARSRHR